MLDLITIGFERGQFRGEGRGHVDVFLSDSMTQKVQGFRHKCGHLKGPRDDVPRSGVFDNLSHDPVQTPGLLEDRVQVLSFGVFGRKVFHEQRSR